MKTIAIREFRTRPRQVRETIAAEQSSLLTANGEAFALVIPVTEDTVDETLAALRIGRAQTALRALRDDARRSGTNRLTPEQIDEVITKARRTRRKRRPKMRRR